MSGESSWTLREILMIGALVFNAGGLVFIFLNHIKHAGKNIDEIFKRLNEIEQRVSRIEGKLNNE